MNYVIFCLFKQVYVVCRRGNNSQLAVCLLREYFKDESLVSIKDIIGGLEEWHHKCDSNFPKY
jgi:adenylyltransferase and sulfurtransferase